MWIIKPDEGWSWVVAFATWMVNLCTNGLLRSQGILYIALMDSFGINRQEASWPFTLCIATACFSGLLTGVLLQIFSTRQVLFVTGVMVALGYSLSSFLAADTTLLALFYGVISGAGTGFVFPSLAVVTNQYFLKHRATANGISLSGIACGALIFPYLTSYFLSVYGLRGAFLILGGMALNVLVAASLIRPGKVLAQKEPHSRLNTQTSSILSSKCKIEDNSTSEHYKYFTISEVNSSGSKTNLSVQLGEKHLVMFDEIKKSPQVNENVMKVWNVFKSTVKDPLYHLVSFSALSSIMVILIFVMIIVDHAVDVGVPRSRGPMLLCFFSVPDLLGRIGSGWISDRGFIRRKNVFAATKTLSGLLMLLLPWLSGELPLGVVSSLIGLLEGMASILTNVLFVEYLGMERLAAALSVWSFSLGLIFLTTPSLIGLFRDFYGHYDSMFYLMGALSLSTALAWTLEPWLVKEMLSKTNKLQVETEGSTRWSNSNH